MSSITEIQKKRFLFLKKLYEVTGGDQHYFINMSKIGNDLGYSINDTELVFQYLYGQGLAKLQAKGGIISITHNGVVEVEKALTNPEESTHYFPSVVNIINIKEMSGSQIQQGTCNSIQEVNYNLLDIENIKIAIGDIKSRIDSLSMNISDYQEAKTQIATVEAQLTSRNPNPAIVSECVKTLRSLLEGAIGSVLAAEILQPLLKHICN